jgi:leucyl-tRNA synthetase
LFFARWEMGGPWSKTGIEGVNRWIKRVWTTILEPAESFDISTSTILRSLRRKTHQTLKNLTHDFDEFEFNTTVSGLMELLNEMGKAKAAGAYGTKEWEETVDIYLRMLAPIAPHVSEEIWALLGKPYSIHTQKWPQVDPIAVLVDEITLVVQVNGKVRDRITVPADISEADAKATALASEATKRFIGEKTPKQVIYVPGKLVNIVV